MSERVGSFAPRPTLGIQDAVSADRHTLILSGELDIASACDLEDTILELCGTGVTGVVLDLRKLTFIDSTGLRAILAAGKLCEKHDHEFLVRPGPRNVQRVFEATGLARRVPFQAGEPSATAS